MPELPSYARRFLAKLREETFHYTKQKLLTGACVGAIAVILRLALWRFHVIKLTQDQVREVWINLLILLGAYAVVFLTSLIANLVRVPGLLDRERAREITTLRQKLELAEPLRGQKEIKLKFAALMKKQVEIRRRLEGAPNGAEFTKSAAECKDWINQTVALLNEAELPTDAEAFAQVGNRAPIAEEVNEFRHVEEWKRGELIRLAMYRKKLDQIMDNRRL